MRRTSILATLVATTVSLLAATVPVLAADEAASEPDLDAMVSDFVGLAPGGAVALTVRDGVTDSAAAGYADATGRPLEIDTPFRISFSASAFIATMILQLVDDEVIELDGSLADYWPEAPFAGDATIRSLLDLTAGIPNYVGPVADSLFEEPERWWTGDELVPTIDPAQIVPGTFMESATPYILLLGMLAHIDGAYGSESLRVRISEPLGLQDTAYRTGPDEDPPADIAASWFFDTGFEGDPEAEMNVHDSAMGPWSSVPDMATYLAALADGRVLSDATLKVLFDDEALFTGIFQAPMIYDDERLGGYFTQVGDSAAGYTVAFAVHPGTGDLVVVMTNNWDLPAWELQYQILDLWATEDAR